MKVLFVITSHETGAWLSEITHPYWALAERGIDVDFASPMGGKIVWTPLSDPFGEGSQEPDDLVSKGFLSDAQLASKLQNTLVLSDVDLEPYDAVHVAGGQGATYDLYPNDDVARVLEHFWKREKVVATICHGSIALGNIPDRVRGTKRDRLLVGRRSRVGKVLRTRFSDPELPAEGAGGHGRGILGHGVHPAAGGQ